MIHKQFDFHICSIAPLSQTVRKYFPEFLVRNQLGNWTLIEIKADYIIDYWVLAAKELYAAQKYFENQMRSEIIKVNAAEKGQIII